MMGDRLKKIRHEIAEHESNAAYKAQGFEPLFVASPYSKIIIIGQAPGIRAQESGLAWNDASGRRLMNWLGVAEKQFRDENIFAHMPMDFYYPGKGKSGDLPPRRTFAPLWHSRLKDCMPEAELIILVGKYAQDHYLPNNRHRTLTDTVFNYKEYLPTYFPLVHPSPLNFRWFAKHKWYEKKVIPALQEIVAQKLSSGDPRKDNRIQLSEPD